MSGSTPDDELTIRRPQPDEWRRARDIRLRALLDTPAAFGETYAHAVTQPDDLWQDRTARAAAGEQSVQLIAELGGNWVGTVTGYESTPNTVDLVAMWVAPKMRRRGAGRRLVQGVIEWAVERGSATVQLRVADGNDGARGLYEACGFVGTGVREPLLSDVCRNAETFVWKGSDIASRRTARVD